MTNREQTKRFLQQVAQSSDGFWEIRFLQEGAPYKKPSYIETKDGSPAAAELEAAVTRVHSLAKEKYTCFVSMNPRTVYGGTKKTQTKQGRFIVADFDAPGLTLAEVKKRIVTRLTPGITPTLIVETSPGHFQCWLLLSEAPATAEEWVALQKGLSGRLDSCRGVHSLAQPMRIPGVPNLKEKYKDSKGKSPLAKLVEVNPENVFDIEALPSEQAAPSAKLQAKDSLVAIQPKSLGDTERAFLDVENVHNDDLSHGSRNISMRFAASGMKARSWTDEEITEKCLAAAEARGLIKDYSRGDCLRQINNGIDNPSLEPSEDEKIGLEVEDEEEADDEPTGSGGLAAEPLHLPTVYPKPTKPYTALSTGLLGEIISSVEPHTEGDSAAIALNLVAQLGNMAGRSAWVAGGSKPLYQNLNLLVIGDSSSGAKGEGAAATDLITAGVDEEWFNNCRPDEINSGEGLKKMFADYEGVAISDGEAQAVPEQDKRRFVELQEFSICFTANNREGSTLSEAIRKLWDCPLTTGSNVSKNPFKGTNPYLSMFGHITPDELERKVNYTDATNGFLNRFLACHSEESKALPESGDRTVFGLWHPVLKKSLKHMQKPGEIFRDAAAREVWGEYYRTRKEKNKEQGIVRNLTARDRPHIAKLSLIIALMNRRKAITLPDLEAAFDLWRYSVETWRFQFGLFNRSMSDRVLAVLNAASKPLSYQEITKSVGANVKAHVLNDSLQRLRQKHVISCKQQKGELSYGIATGNTQIVPTDAKADVLAFIKKNPNCNKTKIGRAFRKLDIAHVLAALVTGKTVTVHTKQTKGRAQSIYRIATATTPSPAPQPKPKAAAKRKKKLSSRVEKAAAEPEAFSNNGQAAGEYDL